MKKRIVTVFLIIIAAVSSYVFSACDFIDGYEINKDQYDKRVEAVRDAFDETSVKLTGVRKSVTEYSSLSKSTTSNENGTNQSTTLDEYTQTYKYEVTVFVDGNKAYFKSVAMTEIKHYDGRYSKNTVYDEYYLEQSGGYLNTIKKNGSKWECVNKAVVPSGESYSFASSLKEGILYFAKLPEAHVVESNGDVLGQIGSGVFDYKYYDFEDFEFRSGRYYVRQNILDTALNTYKKYVERNNTYSSSGYETYKRVTTLDVGPQVSIYAVFNKDGRFSGVCVDSDEYQSEESATKRTNSDTSSSSFTSADSRHRIDANVTYGETLKIPAYTG